MNLIASIYHLTVFDMGFFEPSAMGWGIVIAPMIMKFGTGMKFDIFYTMGTKKFVTSRPLRNYDVITCVLADV